MKKIKYPHIRDQLGCYLQPDYDLDSGTVPEAIIRAIKESDLLKLLSELNELKMEADEVVFEVLNDHSVHIWEKITARDLLTTMIVLAELFEEERLLAQRNNNAERTS